MTFLRLLRTLLLVVASLGYLANGAQAHVKISGGETLTLMMCASGVSKPIALTLPSEPAEEMEDQCCGECLQSIGTEAPVAKRLSSPFFRVFRLSPQRHLAVHPRSPLWPGAPPQGPPLLT